MGTVKASWIQSKLDNLIQYLKPLLPLTNCHMVNFITENCWETYIPDTIKTEIEHLDIDSLCNIFCYYSRNTSTVDSHKSFAHCPSLIEYLVKTQSVSLGSMKGVSLSQSEFCEKMRSWNCHEHGSLHLDQFMSRKKTHEVEVMSGTVAALACASGASHIVDIGGGKGYLSSMLALHHGLKVLSVDSSQINTKGAAKRTEKLQKVWNGVRRRANAVDSGELPTRRGKHWKSKNPVEKCSSDSSSNKYWNTDNDNLEAQPPNSSSSECDKGLQSCAKNSQVTNNLYKQATVFVTQHTNLEVLIEEHFHDQLCTGISLVGLHTCGNLASTCLHLFIADKQIKSLCNVGCCYHLIDEEFFHNPFVINVNSTPTQAIEYGFPMSHYLKSQKFALGRNARMLAAQSLDRITEMEQLPNKSLFYRALLQVLLVKKFGEELPHWQVGRLATKCKDFNDYVHLAIAKLNIHFEISSTEIETLYESYVDRQQQLQAFFLLRVALAPVVEAVVLLDRLLYLHEQGIEEAYLIQLFDPVVSPRCYGLVAIKEPPTKS